MYKKQQKPESSRPTPVPKWLPLPLLLIVVAAAYYPAWHGGLLWDDAAHLTHPALRSLGGLWRIWTDLGATQQYYPLAHTAFWVQQQLWGDHLLGYHLVNIALHAASAYLILMIMRQLGIPGGTIAALIFAVHPIQVESVAWISELKNTLSTVFYLAAAHLYLRYDAGRTRGAYAAALLLFVCALLTKTVTATLPAALLVVFWWRRGAIDVRRDVMPLLPFFAMGIAAGLLTAWVERTMIGAQGAEFDLTVLERFVVAGRAIWFYLGRVLWPHPLIFIYPRWTIRAEGFALLYPVAVVAGFAALWLIRKRTRAPLTVALLFCGALFPALGFVDVYPFRFSWVADHFAYLATIPLIVGTGSLVARVPHKAMPLLAVPLLVLFALTWQQSANYASAETLYRATLENNPAAWLAHNNLGKLLAENGRPEEARVHFAEAVRLNPRVAEHHMNLGRLLTGAGQLSDARRHLEEAVRLEPGNANAKTNLGVVLLRQGDAQGALRVFEDVLRLDPAHLEARANVAAAHVQLGVAHAQSNRIEQASAHFREAVRYAPADAMARYNYGTALLALGRPGEAVTQLTEAVRLMPALSEARINLEQAQQQLR